MATCKWFGTPPVDDDLELGDCIKLQQEIDLDGVPLAEHPFALPAPSLSEIRLISDEMDSMGEPDDYQWSTRIASILQYDSSKDIDLSEAPSAPWRSISVPTIQRTLPDISKGLGQRQDKKDIAALERFVAENLKLMFYQGSLYLYEPPFWRKLDLLDSKMKIREFLSLYSKASCLVERDYYAIYKLLEINPALKVKGELVPPEDKLNFLDGTYNWRTRQFEAHRAEDHFFSCLQTYFGDIGSCSGDTFEAFVQNISNGNPDVREQLLQLIAVAILRIPIKHFFVLLGPSDTGKSQFGRFLVELIGPDGAVGAGDIGKFDDKWVTGAMAGKQLAVCMDLPDKAIPLNIVGIIKQCVGDDPVKGECKYHNPFTYTQKPLLLFAGNHPLKIYNMDREQAFLNRMIVIPFQNPVEGSAMRQHLYTKNYLMKLPISSTRH